MVQTREGHNTLTRAGSMWRLKLLSAEVAGFAAEELR